MERSFEHFFPYSIFKISSVFFAFTRRRNNIFRSALDFLINTCNIIAYDSKANHNNAAGKKLDQNNGGETFKRLSAEFLHKSDNTQDHGNNKHQHAQHGYYLHGSGGEGRYIAYCIKFKAGCKKLNWNPEFKLGILFPTVVGAGTFVIGCILMSVL